jgi:hypothetical protein
MRICPECGAESSDRATHCTLCFKPFPDAVLDGTAAAPPEPPPVFVPPADPVDQLYAPDPGQGGGPGVGPAPGPGPAPGAPAGYAPPPAAPSGYPAAPAPVVPAGYPAPPPAAVDPYRAAGFDSAPESDVWDPLSPMGAPSPLDSLKKVPTALRTSISLPDAASAVLTGEGLVGKAFVAVLLGISQVGAFAVTGYIINYAGRVADGNTELPGWLGDGTDQSFFGYVLKGIVGAVVALVAMAPVLMAGFWLFNQSAISLMKHTQVSGANVGLAVLGIVVWSIVFLVYFPGAAADYGMTEEMSAFLPGRAFRHVSARPSYFIALGLGAMLVFVPGLLVGSMNVLIPKSLGLLAALMLGGLQSGLAFVTATISANLMGQWLSIVYGVPVPVKAKS